MFKKFNFLVFCLLSTSVLGQTSKNINIKKVAELFEAAKFQEVISSIGNFKGGKKNTAKFNYYVGLSYNKIGQFEQAPKYLSKAIIGKVKFKDVYFELGQSYYANNEMQKSARAFLESVKIKFKVPTSTYYIAHISQILEKWKTAKTYYKKIVVDKTADPKIKQIAQFQLGEVNLSYVKEKPKVRSFVRRFVLPMFEKAIDLDTRSNLAKEILRRKNEVEKKYGLNPKYLINGAAAPIPFNASVSQKLKYDSNITYTNELPTQQGTLKDSFIVDTSFNTSYNYVIDQKYILNPSLRITNTDHNDDVNSTVYQNDAYTINGGLKLVKPFSMDKKPGSISYSASYLYSARDRLAQQEKIFAGRTLTHSFSASIPYSKFGPTSLGLSFADFSAYQESLFSSTVTLSLTQIMLFKNLTMLILFGSYSDVTVEDTSNSTASTVFRADYLLLNILPTYVFQVGMGFTLTDTKEQEALRGTEKTLAPSVKVTKNVTKNISASVNIAYSKKSSLGESFAYEKNVSTLEFRYKF